MYNYKSKMLTNEEHDVLWRSAATSISDLHSDLAIVAKANCQRAAVEAMKELYTLGEVTKEGYVHGLKLILRNCGYEVERD